MRHLIRYINNDTFLKHLLRPFKGCYDLYRFRMMSETKFIKKYYKIALGTAPNLEHPKKLTEKIQWLKLHDRTPLHTICADKYKVRAYVKEKVGEKHLIPLVFETKDVKKICKENMPDYPVIIKSNHDSGGTLIIRDKNQTNFKVIRNSLKKALRRNFYYQSKEWEYKYIEPRIIVEKFMKNQSSSTNLLNDFKIHCFNGSPKYIQTILNRETDISETWYDINWEKQDFWYYSKNKKVIPKPRTFNKMITIAKILSEDFIYVRVDLYELDNEVYFGEMTFRPYAGFMMWQPQDWDIKLGELLKLPCD